MKTCVYPGSFDPFTKGHMDVLIRGAQLFDRVVVGVLSNRSKRSTFSEEQRVAWIQTCIEDAGLQEKCSVMAFSGLTVDFSRENKAISILRGLRSVMDMEYELPIAQMNREMAPELETVFILADNRYGHVSSSLVKDVGLHGGKVEQWLPEAISREVAAKLAVLAKGRQD